MIAALLEFSLRQRILVLGLACLLSVAGIFAFQSIPIDAYPDVTNMQVQVLTEAPGLSPVEVERFITYPLELQMTGLPGLAEIRSLSKFALSQITVVFNDDVDIYFARQLVLERIMAAKERLPEGLEPVMAPVTTGLGEVYHYYVEGPNATATDPKIVETELTDQRTMQDWVLRPLLKSVPGVIDVNGMGGFVKQYQVLVDPAKLRKFDLTLHDIYEAVAKKNKNAGEFARLFMVPGMAHCSGGTGPDRHDAVTAVIDWVEKGQAPDKMIASKVTNNQTVRTRPLCPYPSVAFYKGRGDVEAASSFECRSRKAGHGHGGHHDDDDD